MSTSRRTRVCSRISCDAGLGLSLSALFSSAFCVIHVVVWVEHVIRQNGGQKCGRDQFTRHSCYCYFHVSMSNARLLSFDSECLVLLLAFNLRTGS